VNASQPSYPAGPQGPVTSFLGIGSLKSPIA
jgi:hypothetical protein